MRSAESSGAASAGTSRHRLRGLWATALAGSNPVALWAIVLLAFGLRLYHAGNHALTEDDEANVAIANTIRMSLSDPHLVFTSAGHPLLIVYMAHLGAVLFGPTLLGYRMLMVLIGSLTCWALYRLGREVGGKAVGLWAAALVAVDQFHVTGSGTVHVHDIPLVFFGTLALLSCSRLTPTATLRSFLSLGLWMGLAYLGKETALMLWPALWVYFLLTKERRAVLRDPRWYLAHVVFLLLVAPDISWNLLQASGSDGYIQKSVVKAAGGAEGGYGKAISLFLGEVVMWWKPDAYGGIEDYWCWPLRTMHWVAGGLYLFATAWAWRLRQQPVVRLLLVCFAVVALVVTFTKGVAAWDPFWWAAMAMSPAIVFTGLFISETVKRAPRTLWVFAILLVWLLTRTVLTLRDVPFRVTECSF